MEGTIKAVAFDVDGTLVKENFWGPLHELGGMSDEEDKRLFEEYLAHTLSYRDWMKKIVRAYQGNPPSRADTEGLFGEYSLISGADAVVATLKKKMPIALISSNVDTFVAEVGRHFGIVDTYAFCFFEFNDRDELSGIGFHGEGDELEHKVESLENFASKVGVRVDEIAFVGDSKNDLEAFRVTGRGILIGEGSEELKASAWKQVALLPEILDIL